MKKLEITGEIFIGQKFGGISRYFVELVKHLRAQDLLDARIVAPIYVNEYLSDQSLNGVVTGLRLKRNLKGSARLGAFLQRLHARVRSRSPDIVHTSYYGFETLRLYEKQLRVSTFYDMIHERMPVRASLLERKRLTMNHSDRMIAISHATKEDMIRFLNADPDKIDVIHLASSITPPDRDRANVKDYLLWVGARGWYKNFINFVRAFAISKAYSGGVTIVLAGGEKPDATEFQLWKDAGIDPGRVKHVTPSDEDLPELYASARALVYISKLEGFGIPLLEAMTCGCPVVTSNVSSMPEDAGGAALLVDPDCVEEISACIDKMVFSEQVPKDCREKGFLRAQQFSWKRCANETMSVYSKGM